MSTTIKIETEVSTWMDENGVVEVFIGNQEEPIETTPIAVLVSRLIGLYRIGCTGPIDQTGFEALTEVKLALLESVDLINAAQQEYSR